MHAPIEIKQRVPVSDQDSLGLLIAGTRTRAASVTSRAIAAYGLAIATAVAVVAIIAKFA